MPHRLLATRHTSSQHEVLAQSDSVEACTEGHPWRVAVAQAICGGRLALGTGDAAACVQSKRFWNFVLDASRRQPFCGRR